MKNLLITAHLKNGIIAGDRWSPSLDSILAYWHLKNTLTDAEFVAGCANIDGGVDIIDDLPVGIEKYGTNWWYQVSSPITTISHKNEIHTHRSFDNLHAEKYMLPKRGRIMVQAGQYKNKRTKYEITITDKIIWHIVGYQDRINRLLEQCTHLGARIGSGYGSVLRWEIIENGDINIARFKRPLPVDFANKHSITGIKMEWGYRPNVRKQVNQTLCMMI